MWKKGKNLVYFYEKLSILSIGGARLIFMNSGKHTTKSLIKKWDVVMSSLFAWRISISNGDTPSPSIRGLSMLTSEYIKIGVNLPLTDLFET